MAGVRGCFVLRHLADFLPPCVPGAQGQRITSHKMDGQLWWGGVIGTLGVEKVVRRYKGAKSTWGSQMVSVITCAGGMGTEHGWGSMLGEMILGMGQGVQAPHWIFILLASACGHQRPSLFKWFVTHGKFLWRVGAGQGQEMESTFLVLEICNFTPAFIN